MGTRKKRKPNSQCAIDQMRNTMLSRWGLRCGYRWHPDHYRAEFERWRTMWRRCQSTNDSNYLTYGAAGIFPEERWRDFDLFMDDMGPIPQPAKQYQIDRKDNNLGYTAANCRWADLRTQAKNRDFTNKHGRKVLDAPRVLRMVEQYEMGVPQAALALQYDVSHKQVSNIMTGRSWARITGLTPERAAELRATLRSKFTNKYSRAGHRWAPHGRYYAPKKQ